VGGLLVSQLLTLYITPVYYTYIEGMRLHLARKRAPEPVHVEAHPAASPAEGGALALHAVEPRS